MVAFDMEILDASFIANSDLLLKQHFFMKPAGAGKADLASVAGEEVLGVSKNAVDINREVSVAMLGIARITLGGTVVALDDVTTDAAAKAVVAGPGDHIAGFVLEAGVAGDRVAMFVLHRRKDILELVADADFSTNQFHAVLPHSDPGEFVLAGNGAPAIGILQNAPAAAGKGKIITYGKTLAAIGTGGVTVGDSFAAEAGGKLVVAAAGEDRLGWVLATAADGTNGLVFFQPGAVAN